MIQLNLDCFKVSCQKLLKKRLLQDYFVLKSYKGSSLLLEGIVTSYEVVKVSSCHISRRDLD